MILSSSISKNKLSTEAEKIAFMVKKAVHLFDSSASVIFFGSRARGDSKDESDSGSGRYRTETSLQLPQPETERG